MALEIVRFADEHLEAAARLLARRHAADRGRHSELPARFESDEATRELLVALHTNPDSESVVALRDGELAGYLIGVTLLPVPGTLSSLFLEPRSLNIPFEAHAVAPNDGYETYRELYAALVPHFVQRGCFTHYTYASEGDEAALQAWYSLGFGQDLVFGRRGVEPLAARREAAGIEVQRAGSEDIEGVFALVWALMQHRARPPSYIPRLPETERDARERTQQALDDPECVAWIASRGTEILGVNLFGPAARFSPITMPERSTYLQQGVIRPDQRRGGIGTAVLERALAWAREDGFEHVTLNWFAANLSGASFWQRNGFRPLHYRLRRRLDERIAWAGA